MKNLHDALYKVKENPKKYIGKKSINRLDLFIVGYILSQSEELGEYSDELEGFQEFVQEKYKITASVRSSEIIRCFSISDEEAFNKFYKIFEEFQKKF